MLCRLVIRQQHLQMKTKICENRFHAKRTVEDTTHLTVRIYFLSVGLRGIQIFRADNIHINTKAAGAHFVCRVYNCICTSVQTRTTYTVTLEFLTCSIARDFNHFMRWASMSAALAVAFCCIRRCVRGSWQLRCFIAFN